uniref:SPARK domain-containing protein n=1 Tax=Tetradesmus obliquus TaxID=3088 RepID=A0A383WGR6_TETOB|eukprot:jgi/Sobl393_1/7804/SZX76294.1
MHKAALFGAAALLLLAQVQLASAQAAAAPATAAAALPSEMAGSCPLSPADFSTIDYTPLRRACDTSLFSGAAFCSSCICAVGTALVSGFDRAGVLINGRRVGDLAAADGEAGVGASNALMANCSAILGVQLLDSGALTTPALTALGDCSVDAGSLACAAAATPAAATPAPAGAAAASAPEVAAASRTESPAAPAAAPAPSSAAAAAVPQGLPAVMLAAAGVLAAILLA